MTAMNDEYQEKVEMYRLIAEQLKESNPEDAVKWSALADVYERMLEQVKEQNRLIKEMKD